MRLLVVLVASLGAFAPPLSGGTQILRSRTDVVAVYATVVDRSNRPVVGLPRGAFEIREDGTVQAVTVFSADRQAVSVAVMIDESPSLFAMRDNLKSAASLFISELTSADRAIVGGFSHLVRLDPALTADQ